jgi:hypothetical protein
MPFTNTENVLLNQYLWLVNLLVICFAGVVVGQCLKLAEGQKVETG